MSKEENYKLLIRNLRKKQNEKLAIQTTASNIRYPKTGKSIQCEKYYITYTSDVLQIGCKRYKIDEWVNFDDKEIEQMDEGALEWWTKWKPIIMQIIEISPCAPTKDKQ